MAVYRPTKLIRLTLKTYFASFTFIFWTILFILFWIVMFIYVFGRAVPENYLNYYIASAYGYLLIISLGGAGIGMTSIVYSASFSIRYVTKFGRIDEKRFLTEYSVAHLIMLGLLCAIFNALLIAVAYSKHGKIFLPKQPWELVADLVISLLVLYLLSFNLAYLNVLLKRNASRMIMTFLPLMVSFLAYGGLWVDYKYAFYIIPQLVIAGLLYARYSGDKPYTGNIYENILKGTGYADMNLIYLSLFAWIVILFIGGLILLRKTRGVRLEELREV